MTLVQKIRDLDKKIQALKRERSRIIEELYAQQLRKIVKQPSLIKDVDRIEKAKERLEVLKTCNCKEYGELELIIKTRGTKVY